MDENLYAMLPQRPSYPDHRARGRPPDGIVSQRSPHTARVVQGKLAGHQAWIFVHSVQTFQPRHWSPS